jgi:hypothetical protein
VSNYVEVEPNFHKEHIGELSEDWVVMNTSGTSHKLKYNRTMSFPLITEGWETLALFEGFPENVEVVFGHFGGRIFAVVAFHEIGSLDYMSAFHSRSLLSMKTDWFDVKISCDDYISRSLVKYCLLLIYFMYVIFNRLALLIGGRLFCRLSMIHLLNM